MAKKKEKAKNVKNGRSVSELLRDLKGLDSTSPEARSIRRKLRALGHYISKEEKKIKSKVEKSSKKKKKAAPVKENQEEK